jgi:hypothetical protein
MYLTSQSNTQVYSPFGSYVVEQHDSRQPAFDVQRYCPVHAADATPTRLQILLNIVLHRREAASRQN